MNRFVKRGSSLFLFVTWGFAVTLFADAANIDDIYSTNFVVHDDDAASTPPGPVSSRDGASPLSPGKSPPPPVRFILDQDSPSLAADSDASSLVAQALFSQEKTPLYDVVFAVDELHIKLRSLLI